MVGINVPIPVPMAYYSFGGWKQSLFGDTHVHGPEGVHFYTRGKVVTTRWADPAPARPRPRLPPNPLKYQVGSPTCRQRPILSHMCYDRRMTHVASRELRNNTRALLDRVAAGEHITITVDGRELAVLEPVARRDRWTRARSVCRTDRCATKPTPRSVRNFENSRRIRPTTSMTAGLADTSLFIAHESGRRIRTEGIARSGGDLGRHRRRAQSRCARGR